ncbi:MAG: hypothetical protein U0M33_06620 [Lachnospiraceae bacterium]|nr:hypothetical protein [Lachnospiraceae bacterium]
MENNGKTVVQAGMAFYFACVEDTLEAVSRFVLIEGSRLCGEGAASIRGDLALGAADR